MIVLSVVVLVLLLPSIFRAEYELEDSGPFRAALEHWAEVIGAHKSSEPREIKRFENKARYYAARLSPAPESVAERWRRWLDDGPSASTASKPPLAEDCIVALTTIHYVCPHLLARDDPFDAAAGCAAADAIRIAAKSAFSEGRGKPTLEELQRFRSVVGEYRND